MKKTTTNGKNLDQKLLNLTSSIQVKNKMVVFIFIIEEDFLHQTKQQISQDFVPHFDRIWSYCE